MAYQLSYSRTYPSGVAKAFDRVLPMPLADLFPHRYGPIPRVKETRDQDGAWGAHVGQTRTIVLGDGGTLAETLVELDRPRTWAYRLTDITGPMKPLAREVAGRFRFEPAGTGVRITWSWDVEPRNALSARIEPIFRRLWTGYARRAFEEIEKLLIP